MAQPITWKNVNGPDFSVAARLLDSVGQGWKDALAPLHDELKARQGVLDANWTNQRSLNTENFLANATSKYRTADEWNEGVKSGAVQQMLDGMGGNYDRAAVRGFMDQRLAQLQDRDLKGWTFDDTGRDRREQPTRDEIAGLIANQQFDQANARLGQVDLRNEATLYQALTTGRQAGQRFQWDADEAGRKEKLFPLQEQQLRESIANERMKAQAALEAARNKGGGGAEASSAALRTFMTATERLLEGAGADIEKNNIFAGISDNPNQNLETGAKAIKEGYNPSFWEKKFPMANTPDSQFLQTHFQASPFYTIQVPKDKEGKVTAPVQVPIPPSILSGAARYSEGDKTKFDEFVQRKMEDPKVVQDWMAYQQYRDVRSQVSRAPLELWNGIYGGGAAAEAEKKSPSRR